MLKDTKNTFQNALYTHTNVNGVTNIGQFCSAARKVTEQYVKETSGRCMDAGERRAYINDLKGVINDLYPGLNNRADRFRAERVVNAMESAMISEMTSEKKDASGLAFAKENKNKEQGRGL